MANKICVVCGNHFTDDGGKKTCSDKCRTIQTRYMQLQADYRRGVLNKMPPTMEEIKKYYKPQGPKIKLMGNAPKDARIRTLYISDQEHQAIVKLVNKMRGNT